MCRTHDNNQRKRYSSRSEFAGQGCEPLLPHNIFDAHKKSHWFPLCCDHRCTTTCPGHHAPTFHPLTWNCPQPCPPGHVWVMESSAIPLSPSNCSQMQCPACVGRELPWTSRPLSLRLTYLFYRGTKRAEGPCLPVFVLLSLLTSAHLHLCRPEITPHVWIQKTSIFLFFFLKVV